MYPIVIALLTILAILILLGIAIAMQPSAFSVSRSAKFAAPPATVFPLINDFHNWSSWSPWEKLDPELKRTYSGAQAGTGAQYSWLGNKQVGEGRMTITESRPNDLVLINLEFLKPFKATNTTEFTLKPDGNQTLVTWTMSGTKNFFFKAFGLFTSMDKMVGGDFERGLANMKAVVEAPASRAP
jgi:hypothetical protein